MSEYLTTERVCGQLAAAGVDEATVGKVFAARLQPTNLGEDTERKFVLGVPAPGGQVFLLVYRFGLGRPLVKKHPLDEGGPDWRPRWVSVEGPFDLADREAVESRAAELTSATG
jgi:hypothetical protein